MNIVLASDNRGVEMCLTTIYSIAKNNTKKDLKVYILDSDLTDENKKYFKRLNDSFTNLSINIITVDTEKLKNLKMPRKDLSIQAYFRYLIPDLLPKEDKALYLDIDLLCVGDISTMYETDLDGYHVAGVEDYDVKQVQGLRGIRELVSTRYLNSGVLLFNLKTIRADDLTKQFFENAGKNRSKLIPKHLDIFVDQTVANITLTRKKYLKSAYNLLVKTVDSFTGKPVILHYSGSFKPFTYDASGSERVAKYMDLYQQYYFEAMDLLNKDDFYTIINTVKTKYSKQIISTASVISHQRRHITNLENTVSSLENKVATLTSKLKDFDSLRILFRHAVALIFKREPK